MTTHVHKTHMRHHRTFGDYLLWLCLGIVLFVGALFVINIVSQRTGPLFIPDTRAPSEAQTVPDAAVQGVEGYIRAHNNLSAQSLPDASAQGVANYLQAHAIAPSQAVPVAAVQSVADYLRVHDTGPVITDPLVKSVMDYLKAHSIQP